MPLKTSFLVLMIFGSLWTLAHVTSTQITCATPEFTNSPPTVSINQLAIQIVTKKDRGAGTDNAVYFDIGPMAWKLGKPRHNDFEGGRTDTYSLIDINDSTHPRLTTDDILWLRLHKKGILGVTGTRDGLSGAWHPESITLIVNGTAYSTIPIDRPLNSRYWFWRKPYTVANVYTDAKTFARSLRLLRNEPLSGFDKWIGFATTPFKRWGISGWLECPEKREWSSTLPRNSCPKMPWSVCATGIVSTKPGDSTDGLATIDLEVETIEFCTETKQCIDKASLKEIDPDRTRYLRVEYKHGKGCIPKKGDHVRICGKLRWDTDNEGWWEIHPRGLDDVTWLSPRPLARGSKSSCKVAAGSH